LLHSPTYSPTADFNYSFKNASPNFLAYLNEESGIVYFQDTITHLAALLLLFFLSLGLAAQFIHGFSPSCP
jgi:hypothetical protein